MRENPPLHRVLRVVACVVGSACAPDAFPHAWHGGPSVAHTRSISRGLVTQCHMESLKADAKNPKPRKRVLAQQACREQLRSRLRTGTRRGSGHANMAAHEGVERSKMRQCRGAKASAERSKCVSREAQLPEAHHARWRHRPQRSVTATASGLTCMAQCQRGRCVTPHNSRRTAVARTRQ